MRPAVLLSVLWCTAAVATAGAPPKFLARRDYSGAGGFVVVADVNGDKMPDIISLQGNGNINTLLGNGNGTFRTGPATYSGWYSIISGAALDLNGDGLPDLIIDGGPTGFAVPSGMGACFGNSDGTFQPPVFYQAGGDVDLGTLAIGDFNSDGIPDVALAGNSGIWLFFGRGGGIFNPGVLIPVSNAATQSLGVIVADFNGDGKLDLAVGYYKFPRPTGFIVLFGNGNGTFHTPVFYSAPAYPRWMAVSDLNSDGHPDIVLNPYDSPGLLIYLNNGSGAFSAPTQAPLTCVDFAIADVNGDGIPDLVSDLGYVSLGLGNATFAPPVYYPIENAGSGYNVVPADLHKKGLTDVVFGTNAAVSVLLNEGKGIFEDGIWMSLPGSGNCGAAADFNGDGKPDLAVPTTQGITVLLGTGKASAPFTTGPSFTLSGAACPITGDLNGDGIPDLLLGANSLGGVGAYLGNGDGTFRLASVIPVSPGNLVLGDFNHDGKLDLADSSNQLALGNGDGTFQAPVTIYSPLPSPGYIGWIASGDLNNDGWTDLAYVSGLGGNSLYVLLNNQHGGFTLNTVPLTADLFSVMLADLNRDGNLDAVAQAEVTVSVYLGNGQGGFTAGQSTVAYPGPDPLPPQIGDVNGDGIPDLLLPADGSIGIALGKGDGTFLTNPFAVGVGQSPGQILLENLHGQSASAGKPDLVAPDSTGGVTVLINLTK